MTLTQVLSTPFRLLLAVLGLMFVVFLIFLKFVLEPKEAVRDLGDFFRYIDYKEISHTILYGLD